MVNPHRAGQRAGTGAGLEAAIRLERGTFSLDVELTVAPGEVVALVGPNGAGKTTTLRALAGLLRADAATIRLGGVALEERGVYRPPHRRPVAVVFQDYLLFPHLTVLDNVAFGPRAAGRSRAEARRQAERWLERFGIADLAGARPGRLSGGQAQRVALLRALATEPALLLLDEPLAALDARTRLTVRGELRRHLAGFAGATVVITHDPTDAAVLADRLVVLEDGVVVQTGTPAEVTRRPRTDYVARLVGLNLLQGTGDGPGVRTATGARIVTAAAAPGPVFAAFRPSAVALWRSRPDGSPRNLWSATVRGLEPFGDGVRVEVETELGTLAAEVTPGAVADLGLDAGVQVWASVKASEIEVYPAA
jgi:molybdate transport system ATP-binding protein